MERDGPLKFKSGPGRGRTRSGGSGGRSGGQPTVIIGREPVAREEFQGPVEGELAGVVRGDLAPDHHVPLDLLDGQVPDPAVGRLADPGLDLLDQRRLRGRHASGLLIGSVESEVPIRRETQEPSATDGRTIQAVGTSACSSGRSRRARKFQHQFRLSSDRDRSPENPRSPVRGSIRGSIRRSDVVTESGRRASARDRVGRSIRCGRRRIGQSSLCNSRANSRSSGRSQSSTAPFQRSQNGSRPRPVSSLSRPRL